MPANKFKMTAICVAWALLLSACQSETVNEVSAAAPKSAPMIEAMPVAATPAVGDVLSGPVATSGWTWKTSKGGISIAGMAREANGMVELCGVKSFTGRDPRGLNRSVLSQFKFFIDGQFITKGAQHFATAKSREDMKTTPVNCKSTNKPWNPAYASADWRFRHSGTTSF